MNPIYFIFVSLYRFFFCTYFRWKVYNWERVPLKGSLIVAPNHMSFLDPPLVGCGITRELSYLGRKSLFKYAFARWVLKYVNAIPLDRDGGGAAGLKVVLDRLSAGYGVLLFPEGTRSLDGKLQRARSGIGLTVIKSTAPVLPVRVFGTFEAWGKGVSIPRPKRVAVKYGHPMDFAALRKEAQDCSKVRLKEIYQQVADEIMAEIARLEPKQDPS